MEPITTPQLLPLPDVDRLQEVKELFVRASAAWEVEDLPSFVKFLAHAFSLDSHDYSMLMSSGNHMRRACATLSILGAQQSDTVEFHTLKISMALIDTLGFVYYDGCISLDTSRNYVIQKWTQAVHSTLQLLSFFEESEDGVLSTLPPTLESRAFIRHLG